MFQTSHFILALLAGLIFLSIAVSVSDYRYHKIPNHYLLVAIVYFLVLFGGMTLFVPIFQVLQGFAMSVAGMLIAAVFLVPAYLGRQVAAGDVKFGMVIGLFLGPKGAILSILLGAIVGGVWALILAWHIAGLSHLWHNLKFMARSVYLSGFKDMGWDLRSEGAIKMPYGVALGVGAIIIAIEQLFIQYAKLQTQ